MSGEVDASAAPEAGVFTIPRKSVTGEQLGTESLSAEKLGGRVRYRLLKDAVVMYAANSRVGTHQTRTRADVAGSQRKPWRQKGTGRARQGTRKSPLWRGGGVVFGPHPRDYSSGMNRKQRRLALQSALLGKLRDEQIVVIEGLELESPSTRQVVTTLKALGAEGRCLLGTATLDRNLYLSARNLPKVEVLRVDDFNAVDVLGARTILLTPAAFELLRARFGADVAAEAPGEREGGGGEERDDGQREDTGESLAGGEPGTEQSTESEADDKESE